MPWGDAEIDHRTTSEPIRRYMRRWSSLLASDAERDTTLGARLAALPGTAASSAVEQHRTMLSVELYARLWAATWLNACGLHVHAANVRALAPMIDGASVASARPTLQAAHDAAELIGVVVDLVSAAQSNAAWAAGGYLANEPAIFALRHAAHTMPCALPVLDFCYRVASRAGHAVIAAPAAQLPAALTAQRSRCDDLIARMIAA